MPGLRLLISVGDCNVNLSERVQNELGATEQEAEGQKPVCC